MWMSACSSIRAVTTVVTPLGVTSAAVLMDITWIMTELPVQVLIIDLCLHPKSVGLSEFR